MSFTKTYFRIKKEAIDKSNDTPIQQKHFVKTWYAFKMAAFSV